MCPPLPLNFDASAMAYRRSQSSGECQTLRLPVPVVRTEQPETSQIMATSAASASRSSIGPPPAPVIIGEPAVRLPHEDVSASSLPRVKKSATPSESGRRLLTCASSGKLAELYQKCAHHREVSPSSASTTGDVLSCRSVIMEYLECTAGER